MDRGINLIRATAGLLLAVTILLAGAGSVFARDALYERNGEVYLLLGGDYCLYRGVYRLNNPSNSPTNLKIGRLYDPGPSMSLAVDLDRNLNTISIETTDLSTMRMARQVVDDSCLTDWVNSTVYKKYPWPSKWTAAQRAGFGAHQYCHHYLPGATSANPGTLYRAGNPGDRIWGSTANRPYCGGPGTPLNLVGSVSLPTDLITVMVPGEDQVYPGKAWYSIPNGSWYSSWNTSTTNGNYSGMYPQPPTSYIVNQDTFVGNNYNWKLLSWHDPMVNPTTGPSVGSSYQYTFSRNRRNACLDSCKTNTTPYGVTFIPRFTSVAFMPFTMNGTVQNASRTYFFSKEKTTTSYYISKSTAGGGLVNYVPPADNPIIGSPTSTNVSNPDLGARWIGVSSKTGTDDWVYVLGTPVIQNWYNAAANANVTNMNIVGVSVSNQWNQKGGIIFAYDKTSNSIYKLVRDETLKTTTEYEIFSGLTNILDIKADGDGDVFYCREEFTPTTVAGLNDSHIYAITAAFDASEPTTMGDVIYVQTLARKVYERKRGTSTEAYVGSQTTGLKYYIATFEYPNASGEMSLDPNGFGARLAAYGGTWKSTPFNPAPYPYVDSYSPPDRTELAVINVPAPPETSGSGAIDLVGPFETFPNPSNNSTNQSSFLTAASGHVPTIDHSKVYFYQVENYPLYPVSQAPETDWNGNGYMGGFITSIINPDPSATPRHITYNWILWSVEDPYGKPITPPDPHVDPTTPDTTSGESFGMYSPAGGKYVLTCKVVYDYYNYNAMPYGSMFADRENYRVIGSVAVNLGTTNLRNSIKNTVGFGAISDTDLSTMVPGSAWAAIPILVATSTATFTPVLGNAAIERWDCSWDNPGAANPMTGVTWSSNALHGIDAGATYAWRIALASQTNLMMNIAGSTNITPNTANYNWVAHQLLDPTNTYGLYMNNPGQHNLTTGIEFRNQLGDLAWEGDANFTGTLIATTPAGVISLPLFGGGSGGTSSVATFSKLSVDWPTDPKEAQLQIQATRMFKVRAWVWDNQYNRYLSKFWMKKVVTLTAQTKVLVLDRKAPTLEQDFTFPRNIFAFTGGTIDVGKGPSGMTNPASLSVMISDDNPWENGDVQGVTAAVAAARDTTNAGIRASAARNSAMNLLSVFSKQRRSANIEFELATPATHTLKVTYQGIPGANVASEAINTPGSSLADMRALIMYAVDPISNIYTGTIPVNYANNTPGYAPYRFRITVTDSSGNTLMNQPINTALHVRDDRAPILWGVITSRKDGLPRVFPEYDSARLATSGFDMPDSGSNITWTADANGNLPSFNGGPLGRVFKALGTSVTKPFTDAALINQVKAGVPPRFFEENVEFEVAAHVADNAGMATNTLTMKIPNFNAAETTLTTTSNRGWGPDTMNPPLLYGIFQAAPGDCPMALPVTMTAVDDARNWTYYPATWKTTSWPTLIPVNPGFSRNTRTLTTVIPVYGSEMTLRLLEKGMR